MYVTRKLCVFFILFVCLACNFLTLLIKQTPQIRPQPDEYLDLVRAFTNIIRIYLTYLQMTRYKQTEFTEDDSSSIGGIQLNEATGHTGMQIRYHTARVSKSHTMCRYKHIH